MLHASESELTTHSMRPTFGLPPPKRTVLRRRIAVNSSISRVSAGGKEIALADGTTWLVSAFDAFHTCIWMLGDKIQYDVSSLINLTRNKRVAAKKK